MKGQSVLTSSKSEEWATPQDFYNALNEEFNFTLDPCATDENHKCANYYTKEQDGLKMDWGGAAGFLQSTIRQEVKRMGCEVLRRGTQRKYIGRYVNTGQNRHNILSRLHTTPGRS